MIKLYKQNPEGILSYHEAWMDGKSVVEHWGLVGDHGETVEHRNRLFSIHTPSIESVLRNARLEGFIEFDEDRLNILMIEYLIDGMGNSSDIEKRHRLEIRMNYSAGLH